jgi:uncharacterized repeat protein (TIGR03803 family)
MFRKMTICCLFFSLVGIGAGKAQSKTTAPAYTLLYSFCALANCTDGTSPAGVILDSAGDIYGVANSVLFELDNGGSESVLYNTCSSGYCLALNSGLVRDAAGNLYGTSAAYVPPVSGGSFYGTGSVFEYSGATGFTELYSFAHETPGSDGSSPEAGLAIDTAGNLYGTTNQGGTHGFGTVFSVNSGGNETVLYNFDSVSYGLDGLLPQAPLLRDDAGNLYGTTTEGGASMTLLGTDGNGTLFRLDASGNETVLYSFCTQPNCADGSTPTAGVIEDAAGNFYGTTSTGGTGPYAILGDSANPQLAGGVVFKVDATGHETVLHSFCSQPNCADGSVPVGRLVLDAAGNIYGTTQYGGTGFFLGGGLGSLGGTVFKIDTAGNETVLYNFCVTSGCPDGWQPDAGLTQDASGNVYGTTELGGAHTFGVVFKLAANALPSPPPPSCVITSEPLATVPGTDNKSRTTIGVGESVKLTSNIPVTWKISSHSTGTLTEDIVPTTASDFPYSIGFPDGFPSEECSPVPSSGAVVGRQACFTAGYSNEATVITATGNGSTCSIGLKTIQPKGLQFQRLQSPPDKPDYLFFRLGSDYRFGMISVALLLPGNVSFVNTLISELDVAKPYFADQYNLLFTNNASNTNGWLVGCDKDTFLRSTDEPNPSDSYWIFTDRKGGHKTKFSLVETEWSHPHSGNYTYTKGQIAGLPGSGVITATPVTTATAAILDLPEDAPNLNALTYPTPVTCPIRVWSDVERFTWIH